MLPREGSVKKATETVVERRGSGGHTDRALMQVVLDSLYLSLSLPLPFHQEGYGACGGEEGLRGAH